MPRQHQMPTRAPALFLLVGMVAGFYAADQISAPLPLALIPALLLAALTCYLADSKNRLWLLIFIAGCALTAWAYGTLRLPLKPESTVLELPIREAFLRFKVERVMPARHDYGNVSGIAKIIEANPTSRLSPDAKLFFRIDLPEAETFNVLRGSVIEATGVLCPLSPQVAPDSFEGYLKDTGIHYRFERTSGLKLIAPPSPFDQFCQQMNENFQRYLRLGAPVGQHLDSIYIAMLLGRKAELNNDQKDRFRMTGTMHFFAISGLHIGVIATVMAQFLILIRVPRRVSPIIGLPLLYLYVEITGASPSAVRAFLMAVFFWSSFAFTRQRSPLAALAASAVFVLIMKPDQLWSIGFQLSYTVVLSILLFGLPLYEIASERCAPFRYLPKANWTRLQQMYAWAVDALLLLFAISFSAWLASAPLSAAFFGYLSPGAILLNMLLVNLAALAISTGVISLALALIGLESVAGFINHAAWVSIHLMDRLVIGSTKVPGTILHCNGFLTSIAYFGLITYFAILFWLHHERNKRSTLSWLLPPTVILVALLYGLSIL
ncbi:ComEC/Rec2 family competence protein [Coraliomargarita algicola]|uniref:ComEC/Rec2 family competence protein n=1 Tax=Coraliomargarita algicola TaxID=3092156 RepID=A0ABZ0RPH5_9BACT|nr:ComEC/Rec2 family competence protein [Coraliomargarita sp. J2-16]WPJ97997.1 ComEC/Rec2 family competence protein [Coraliomargarita sp. J2-16]